MFKVGDKIKVKEYYAPNLKNKIFEISKIANDRFYFLVDNIERSAVENQIELAQMFKRGDKIRLKSNQYGACDENGEYYKPGDELEVYEIEKGTNLIVIMSGENKQYLHQNDAELIESLPVDKMCNCTMNQLMLSGCKCGGK